MCSIYVCVCANYWRRRFPFNPKMCWSRRQSRYHCGQHSRLRRMGDSWSVCSARLIIIILSVSGCVSVCVSWVHIYVLVNVCDGASQLFVEINYCTIVLSFPLSMTRPMLYAHMWESIWFLGYNNSCVECVYVTLNSHPQKKWSNKLGRHLITTFRYARVLGSSSIIAASFLVRSQNDIPNGGHYLASAEMNMCALSQRFWRMYFYIFYMVAYYISIAEVISTRKANKRCLNNKSVLVFVCHTCV